MSLLSAYSFSEDPSRYLALAAGVLLLAYLLLRSKLKRKDPLKKSSAAGMLSQQRGVERDMSQLLVELSSMARQITAQLDTRAAKLELLIQEADQKIEKLAALRAAGGPAASVYPSSGVFAPADEPEVDPRHVEVYRLADGGRSAMQIAQQLERPSGEIELILALRPKAGQLSSRSKAGHH